jgi:hypothetical protein
MVKIWLLLMLMSTPNQPSVKYNAAIYPTEDQCIQAREGFMEAFEAKSQEYKDEAKTEALCIPFDSYPIKGMNSPIGV